MSENNQQEQNQPKNKNNKIAGAVIVVIILLLPGWAYAKNSKNRNVVNSNEQNTDMKKSENENQAMSLKDLMQGKSQKCEVSYESQGSKAMGIVYVSNGKLREDFTNEVSGKTEITHIINDGTTQYMWANDGAQMALKMPVTEMQANQPAAASNQTRNQQTVDFEAKHDYKCDVWNEDQGVFEIPLNIKFTDYGDVMKSAQATPAGSTNGQAEVSGSSNVKAMQCAACENLSGEQKTQCKAALACN